LFNVHFPGQLG